MKKIERVGDWTEQISKAGKRYYYNNVTEVSQWDKPDEWKEQERKQEEAQRRDQAMKFAIHNSVVSQPPQPPVLPTHTIYTQQPYTAPPPPFASHPPPPMNIHHPPPPPSMLIPPYSPAFPPHVPPMNAAMNPVNFMVPPPPVSSVPAPIHGSSSSQHGTPLSSGHNAMDRDRERDREAHSSHQRDYAPRRSSDKPPCIGVSTPHTSQPSSQMHLQRQDSGQQYGHSGQQSNAPHQHHYSSHSHSHHTSQQHQQYQQHGSQPHSSQHRAELNRADSRSSTHSSPAPVDPEIRSRKRPEERSEERPNKVQRRDSGVAEVKSGIDNRNQQSSPHNDKHGGSQPMDIDEEKADSNTVNFSKYYDKGLAEKGWKMMQLENLTLSMKKINSARIDAADILAESTETVVRLYSAISMTTTCELRRRIYDDKIKCNRDFQKWLDTRMKNGGGSTGSAIASASALNSSYTNNS